MKAACRQVMRLCMSGVVLALVSSSVGADDIAYKFGFIERVRNTYYNNIIDFNSGNDDKTDFMRVRTSLWGQLTFSPKAMLYAKVTNEFRPYLIDPRNRDFDIDEVFLDNFYLKFSGGESTKVTATLGRQNIIYGEGFIILDGSPLEGSRSIYMDAAKISINQGTTTVDLLAILNKDKDWLPVINEKPQALQNVTLQTYGAYLTKKAESGHKIEAYGLYQIQDRSPDELKFTTIGARISRGMVNNLSFATEWAGQFGSMGNADLRAFGGYAYAARMVQQSRKGTIKLGAYYLNDEWTPVLSRWPKWSELYIYSHITEFAPVGGAPLVANWSNTLSPFVSYSMSLPQMGESGAKGSFTATYYHLRASKTRTLSTGGRSGKTRGNEIQGLIKIAFNKYLSGHFLYDYFIPGNFYPAGADAGSFVRAELMLKM